MIRIYVVTGLRLYRDALVRALASCEEIEIVGTASDPVAADGEIRASVPDIVAIDLPVAVGSAWARAFAVSVPTVRVMALGVRDEEDEAVGWAEAGVCSYVGVDASIEEFIRAAEALLRDEATCSGRATAFLVRRLACPDPSIAARLPRVDLTEREREVVCHIARHRSNQEIASELHIALPTVKNHVHNILAKLGVNRRFDAVRIIRESAFGLDRSMARQ